MQLLVDIKDELISIFEAIASNDFTAQYMIVTNK